MVHQQDRFRGGWNKAVWTRIKDLYHPLPEALLVAGTFLRCGNCRLPAMPRDRKAPEQGPLVAGPETWCEGEECPHGVRLDLIRDPDQVWLLRRPLRAFFTPALRVEREALDELDRAGIGYEALQGELSAYRLRSVGLGARSIHVYDRVQPALMASRFTDPATPLPGLTLVVVPHRLAERGDYRVSFTEALPTEFKGRVVLTGPQDLVRHVRGYSADKAKKKEGDDA